MAWLKSLALLALLGLAVGCSGSAEVKPANKDSKQQDIGATNKAMEESMGKMNIPTDMMDRMKTSGFGGVDGLKMKEGQQGPPSGAAPGGAAPGGAAPGGAPKQ